ncbi:uncharacterized protein JN550_007435 [Neoarthrinium moseri]|uniref:uncharacterized protein n=1 Tax=Neoarthrinium moseri TaxID=1658444 RepID=UPI001FDBAB57|nr:uncharacterized protein JN550_007435 [Neoarthrinium moseri]KAI1866888.1 hypothetical protein JN550_007435 [Neoarthrinium moseri]
MTSRSSSVRLVEWKPNVSNTDEDSCAAKVRNFEFLSSKKETLLPVARKPTTKTPSYKVVNITPVLNRGNRSSTMPSAKPNITNSAEAPAPHSPKFKEILSNAVKAGEILRELPEMSTKDLLLLKRQVDSHLAKRGSSTPAVAPPDDMEEWDVLDEDLAGSADQFDIVKHEEV